jgi:hypothetical protein
MSIKLLRDQKEEYLDHLFDILYEPSIRTFQNLYDDVLKSKECNPKNVLKLFQHELSKIPEWNQLQIEKVYETILNYSKCSYFPKLLKTVYILTIKIILLGIPEEKRSKIKLKVPSPESFIHRCLIHMARELWKRPYLFYHLARSIERQNNLYHCEVILKKKIKVVIRETIPMDWVVDHIASPTQHIQSEEEEPISDVSDTDTESEEEEPISSESDSKSESEEEEPISSESDSKSESDEEPLSSSEEEEVVSSNTSESEEEIKQVIHESESIENEIVNSSGYESSSESEPNENPYQIIVSEPTLPVCTIEEIVEDKPKEVIIIDEVESIEDVHEEKPIIEILETPAPPPSISTSNPEQKKSIFLPDTIKKRKHRRDAFF